MEVLSNNAVTTTSFAEQNNEAISCWHAGRPHETMTRLQTALSSILNQVQTDASAADAAAESLAGIDLNDAPSSSAATASTKSTSTSTPSVPVPIRVTSGPPVALRYDGSFLTLYNRFLSVNGESVAATSLTTTTSSTVVGPTNAILSAVVLYNMALYHHLTCLGNGQQHQLPKARSLYRMSLNIVLPLQQQMQQLSSDGDDVNRATAASFPDHRRLLLALLNNMAHVESHFVDRIDEMKQALELLRENLISANDNDELDGGNNNDSNESTTGVESADEHLIFFENAMFLNAKELTTAAAA